MKTSLILKSQENIVLQIIKENGFDPLDFSWSHIQSNYIGDLMVSKLTHNNSQFYFTFDFNDRNKHITNYSPGETTFEENQYPGSWDGQISYLKTWIDCLKREIEAPNLWEALLQERSLSKEASNEEFENIPFLPNEIQKLKTSLDELKQFLITTNTFDATQTKYLNTRIEYLLDASNRMGKKDWITLFIGVLFNIVLSLALPSNSARELFSIASKFFSWLLKNALLLNM